MTKNPMDVDTAWQLALNARDIAHDTLPVPGTDQPALSIDGPSWALRQPASEQAMQLLSLFLPLCRPLPRGTPYHVIGQLGQSLDGRIATVTGCSRFINGDDGILHLHRIRALCDAVIVGAGTALNDNPRLTVRRAPGPNPVRVVIDRNERIPGTHHLFTDGAAPTLRLVAGSYSPGRQQLVPDTAITIPCLGSANAEQPVAPGRILEVLADFGLRKIFIEGGGLTVSTFLKAGLLDRLHVMVAPMIIGSGRPAFSLPEIDQLDEALWPSAQFINLGSDMLFDLAFDAGSRLRGRGPKPQQHQASG